MAAHFGFAGAGSSSSRARWQSLGTQSCTAPRVSSPQAGEAHKPEPFPGRYLALAKISPGFWINRALQGYQYLWINLFEGREGAFIIIHSAQRRLWNSTSPPAARPLHQSLEAVQTKPCLLSVLTAVRGIGIDFWIGAGNSNKDKRFLGGVCLNLRCLLALDVMKASCLSPGAPQASTTTHQTLLGAANFFPRKQQQPATKARLLSNSTEWFLKLPPEGSGQ